MNKDHTEIKNRIRKTKTERQDVPHDLVSELIDDSEDINFYRIQNATHHSDGLGGFGERGVAPTQNVPVLRQLLNKFSIIWIDYIDSSRGSVTDWARHQLMGSGKRRWSSASSLTQVSCSISMSSTSSISDISEFFVSSFFQEIERFIENGNEDRCLVFVYRELGAVVYRRNFKLGERILSSVSVKDTHPDVLVAIAISIADIQEDALPSKKLFLRSVLEKLQEVPANEQRYNLVVKFV
ncbi:MAG: hypothetical protein JNL58_04345 [Planctomyces sp.]|nr:hypothetical protein [Planctomyces sp.]